MSQHAQKFLIHTTTLHPSHLLLSKDSHSLWIITIYTQSYHPVSIHFHLPYPTYSSLKCHIYQQSFHCSDELSTLFLHSPYPTKRELYVDVFTSKKPGRKSYLGSKLLYFKGAKVLHLQLTPRIQTKAFLCSGFIWMTFDLLTAGRLQMHSVWFDGRTLVFH